MSSANTNTQHRGGENTHSVAEASQAFVRQHALPSTMAAFGLGIGAGVALAMLLSDGRQQQEASTALRLGRQLLDSMASAVPENLTKFGR